MKTILVTGGCGFIGSNYIRWKLDSDPHISILNIDKLTYAGNLENLADLEHHSRLKFYQQDICDGEGLSQIFEANKIGGVINFAAESHVDRSILDSSPFIHTNILGTQILLDLCRKYQIEKYVQVSTDEVYGSLGPTGLFTEETPLAPNSPYSASKASADLLVRSYVQTFDFPAVITRCSNNYGPYQFPEKLIPLFISNISQDLQVPVYGDGSNIRDWIYVVDHCRGIDLALQKGNVGEVYNFGGECELTNMELTLKLLSALKKPESLIKFVKDRPGHDLRYAIDCHKAKTELGWHPEMNFECGLAETITWYQDHVEWIERIKSGDYIHYYTTQYQDRLNN